VLDKYGVTLRVFHGFNSTTGIYLAHELRLLDRRPLIVLYVGDFDPSGLYMSVMDLPKRIHAHRLREVALRHLRLRAGVDRDERLAGRWHDLSPDAVLALGARLLNDPQAGDDGVVPIFLERVALTDADVLRGICSPTTSPRSVRTRATRGTARRTGPSSATAHGNSTP
jgi:hypothetical protein